MADADPDRTRQLANNLTRDIQLAEAERVPASPPLMQTPLREPEPGSSSPDPLSLLERLRSGVRRPKRVGRPPRFRPPNLSKIEDRYEAHLVAALEPLVSAVETFVLPEYDKWVSSAAIRLPTVYEDNLRTDDEYDLITALFDRIRFGLLERETALTSATRYAAQLAAAAINGENVDAIRPVLQRVLRVDPFQAEPWLLPESRNWVTQNVSLIRSIGHQYLGDVEQLIYRMVREGKSIKEVRAELQEKFGVSKSRAQLIARDQVSKFNGRLTEARQTNLGINEYIWRTMGDERVRGPIISGIGGKYPKARPAHTVMDGVKCRWDNPNVYHNGKRWVPRTGLMPKAHPSEEIQCVLPDSKIYVPDHTRVLFRRWYSGKTTKLIVESGGTLHCTPNHPVLTAAGWKPAQDVDIGDYMFNVVVNRNLFGKRNIQAVYPMASQIFDALAQPGNSVLGHGCSSQFHGDGSNQDVNVVRTDGGLVGMTNSEFGQELLQEFFTVADMVFGWSDLPGARSLALCLDALGCAPVSVVRGAAKLLALFSSHLRVSQEHRLAAVARFDANLQQASSDNCSGHSKLFRYCLFTDSSKIQSGYQCFVQILSVWSRAVVACRGIQSPSAEILAEIVGADGQHHTNFLKSMSLMVQPIRVVEKRVGEFSSHRVYNLETGCGWYTANSFIVQNCRCTAFPVIPEWMMA